MFNATTLSCVDAMEDKIEMEALLLEHAKKIKIEDVSLAY